MPFNVVQFRKEVKKNIKNFQAFATNAAAARFVAAKRDMLEEFNEHPVTQEIESGPDGDNITNTLEGKGNLFSFIGFYENEQPTEPVRQALEDTYMAKTPQVVQVGSRVEFRFRVFLPDIKTLANLTPMHWDSDKSWLTGIEKGISGLGYYIYWKRKMENSRSGTGIQGQNQLRPGGYRKTKYMTQILNNFKNKFGE